MNTIIKTDMTTKQKLGEERRRDELYGPKANPDFFKNLKPVTNPHLKQKVVFERLGRAISGEYMGIKKGRRVVYTRNNVYVLDNSTKLYQGGEE